jgi:hypothetical protein
MQYLAIKLVLPCRIPHNVLWPWPLKKLTEVLWRSSRHKIWTRLRQDRICQDTHVHKFVIKWDRCYFHTASTWFIYGEKGWIGGRLLIAELWKMTHWQFRWTMVSLVPCELILEAVCEPDAVGKSTLLKHKRGLSSICSVLRWGLTQGGGCIV